MRLHIDVLGWLYLIWGGLGLLSGSSLLILAAGARRSIPDDAFGLGERAGLSVLLVTAALLLAGGAACAATGWSLRLTRTRARLAGLLLAIPNLILIPFGTALGAYAIWVLLNDDARRVFAPVAPVGSGPR
jgi:hypothetical protein